MIGLGDQCIARASFVDATDAFTAGTHALHELHGLAPAEVGAVKLAPFFLGNALFAQKKFAEASAAIEDGLAAVPAFGVPNIRQQFRNPALYDVLLTDLSNATEQKPDNAAPAVFVRLSAAVHRSSGRREKVSHSGEPARSEARRPKEIAVVDRRALLPPKKAPESTRTAPKGGDI